LSKQKGICAGRFTMADISVGYALLLAEYLGLEPEFPESVRYYWQQLKDRTGYGRARDAEVAAAIAQGISTIPAPLQLPGT
jgi:glutathione S-transferase